MIANPFFSFEVAAVDPAETTRSQLSAENPALLIADGNAKRPASKAAHCLANFIRIIRIF